MAFDMKKYQREWYHRNSERLNHKRRTDLGYHRMLFKSHLKQKYGLSLEEFDDLVLLQEGRCALCDIPSRRLWVDHDHETDKIRGLLCPSCNSGLGFLKEHPNLLRRAIKYLQG